MLSLACPSCSFRLGHVGADLPVRLVRVPVLLPVRLNGANKYAYQEHRSSIPLVPWGIHPHWIRRSPDDVSIQPFHVCHADERRGCRQVFFRI